MVDYFVDTTGEEVAYNHEKCGDTRKRMFTRYTGEGWVYHCHNCGKSGFKTKVAAERGRDFLLNQKKKVVIAEEKATINLPSDASKALPVACFTWLFSYGLEEKEIDNYKFSYAPKSQRLILPIYEEDNLVGYQARYFGKDSREPKYLTYRGNTRSLQFQVKRRVMDTVVVVEDIISAIKVGRQFSSMAVLGSPQKAGKGLILKLRPYSRVVVWFDRDKLKASLLWASQLKCLGFETKVVWTDKDPKAYPNNFIAQQISY